MNFLSAAARVPSVVLNDAQIDFFKENGFLTIDSITTPEEIALLKTVFEDLMRRRAGFKEGAQFDLVGEDDNIASPQVLQIMNPLNYANELRHTLFRSNASAIARQLLGDKAAPFFEHAIMKPASDGPATPWHQDEAYRTDPNFEYRQIGIWMPLQPATIENGCMHYIAGSHLGEVLTHRSPSNNGKTHALECCDAFNPAMATACPLPAGGCVIHDGRTLHYAGPNVSNKPRWAYVLDFDLPPKRCMGKREFPWNETRRPADMLRKRAWLRRGGVVVESFRRLRGGFPKDVGRLAYLAHRAWHSLLGH